MLRGLVDARGSVADEKLTGVAVVAADDAAPDAVVDVADPATAAAAAAAAAGMSLVDLLEVIEAESLDKSYSSIMAEKFCC